MPIFKYRSIAAYRLEEIIVPLKPIYGKAPLTSLNSLALRPGQVRMEGEKMAKLYALLNASGKDCAAAWEPAFRMACLLCKKPMEEPSAKWILACAESQQENGALPGSVMDALHAASAMMAVYAFRPDRALLEKLMRWCAWVGANWETVVSEREIRVNAADLTALLCEMYRITGKKALLKLVEQLRQAGMDWSSVLHTFSVQRPMKRVIRHDELESGMADENNHEAGFYTRQYLTCHGESLADGARAALESCVFSGNGQEATAVKTGWEKISRWHGAVCGGVTADETLGGQSPASAVDAAAIGAWAEVFASQLNHDAAWAGDALERLWYNAMPAAVLENGLVPFQRMNGLRANCGTRDCYDVHEGDAQAMRALVRLTRGFAAAAHAAVCSAEKGADINLCIPGSYALQLGGAAVRMAVTGKDGAYTVALSMKESTAAAIRIRVPAWTNDACISVNDEGGYEGKKNEYLTLERTWNDGDVIHVSFGREAEVIEGYHQSASVRWGEKIMVCPVTEDKWAYALAGQITERDGAVYAMVKHVPGWKAAHGVPADLPVLPETSGEAVEIELKPYAETPCRLSVLPRAQKA